MSRVASISTLLALLVSGTIATAQHTLEIVEDNGPANNRIDLVLMGDGYSADQQDDLAEDTAEALEAVFEKVTFEEYRSFFNFARISTVSPESGADHPDDSEFVDTFFDCAYDCAGLDRLICCDHALITSVAAELYPEFDFVLLVVNDSEYGGSGGAVAITSSSAQAYQVPPHEFGHTVGVLGDEYDDPWPAWECEDVFPNVSPTYDPAELKWSYWVDDATPLPTPESAANGDLDPVGAYEGACYEPSDWYRPVWACLMRDLDSQFCPVCAEAMVLSFYGFVEPIDSHEPAEDSITGAFDEVIELVVEAVEPEPSTIEFSWTLDGNSIESATDGTLELELEPLEPGEHVVEVTVRNATELVLSDAEGLMEQSVSWSILRAAGPGDDPDGSFGPPSSFTAVSPGGCQCSSMAAFKSNPASVFELLLTL